MKHHEYKLKHDDPNWALMFFDYMDSLSKSLGVKGVVVYRSIQFFLVVTGVATLCALSMLFGYGILIGIIPLIYASFQGKVSLNFFDMMFLFLVGMFFSFLARVMGADNSLCVCVIFGLAYFSIGGTKFVVMGVMQSRMYADEDIFDIVQRDEGVMWLRIN